MGISSFPLAPGETPLSDEEKLGLRPSYITTIGELNQWEQQNILDGQAWALGRRRKDILSEKFIKTLHKKMFGQTWEWAGQYRKSDKNIGVPAYKIPIDIREVIDTVRYWDANETFDTREIAIRLHHRIVQVHPFPNGNGRHARLLADVFLFNKNEPRFTWGGGSDLRAASEIRRTYLDALREADNLDYEPLRRYADS